MVRKWQQQQQQQQQQRQTITFSIRHWTFLSIIKLNCSKNIHLYTDQRILESLTIFHCLIFLKDPFRFGTKWKNCGIERKITNKQTQKPKNYQGKKSHKYHVLKIVEIHWKVFPIHQGTLHIYKSNYILMNIALQEEVT